MKVHVNATDVAKIRECHQGMLDASTSLKASVAEEGNTLAAVKIADMIRGIEALNSLFEAMVSEDFEIVEAGTGEYNDPVIDAFVKKAGEMYGPHGKKQAKETIASLGNGDVDPADYPFIRDAMIQAFWDAKEYNKRYAKHHTAADAKAILEGSTTLL